ncbi:trehalase-like protein [Marivirga sp. S37H4]|uniref:Trehalase-like protein n=1 Tax=Marivirga aurantiaca TaxID=2802615 RepID=A0A935C6Z9_9BACT|nr:trehalase family glycosidase [Marivirga aurantiaca]MBK6264057.1 trehalase-like protein [Marivirga aurantiaca]
MTEKEIFERTRKLIYENMIKGRSKNGKKFHYTKPAPERYPFQFFWDTCYHVFILSALGEHDMAREHLISLFAMQEDDGFVGHMIYWNRLKPGRMADFFQSKPQISNLYKSHMSALIQPPLVAQAVAKIYENSGDKDFLAEMLPKLKKYYLWLAKNRDFDGDGLLTIISPFESGIDWKPTYDVALGFPEKKADWRLFLKVVWIDFRNFLNNYNLEKINKKALFRVKDVGFNTIYAQNLQALSRLCHVTNDDDDAYYSSLGDKVTESILKIMYDEKDAAFYDVYGKKNTKIKILTPTVFYPVVIDGIPHSVAKKVMEAHFFNEEEFDTSFPLPSVAKNHPSFNPEESLYIWRGPTWIAHNWFMHQFLMESGYKEESKKMIDSILKLIAKSGFREYYNPFTGEGYGAKDFTWAGLVIDMIQMEKRNKSA